MKKRDTNPNYLTQSQAADFLGMGISRFTRRVFVEVIIPDLVIGNRNFFLVKSLNKIPKEKLKELGGRNSLKPPTENEIQTLTDYVLGRITGVEANLKLGVNNKQKLRSLQLLQSIAYRKFFFDVVENRKIVLRAK